MQVKYLTASLFKKFLGFALMAGVFFTSAPQFAFAQWASTNPDILANDLAGTIQAESKDQVKGALLGALAGVGISLLDYVATLTAQSTAVWIANGGAGQHPLFNSQTIEEVGQSIAGTVVSDVLDKVIPGAGSLAAIGINPNNPDLTGVLRKMLGSPYRPVKLTEDGRLDGGSIGRNFSSYIASTAAIAGAGTQAGAGASTKVLADVMNAASMNEFYGLLRTYGQTQARASNLAAVKQYQDIINSGFQDLKSPISNKTKWPAASVKQKLDDAIKNKQENDADIGKGLVQAAGENAVIQVGINFLTTFAGTLFGELTQKLFDGLLDGIDPVTVNPFDPTQVTPGRRGEDLFRSLGTFRPLKATGYSLTAQLASCPATLLRSARGVYTCAMDTSFVTVVTRGNSNNPSTVQEAIEGGEINGNWPLIGPEAALNKDPNCYQRAFCHSNLLKLRKARIIPIGWEMAAELSGDGKYTLKQVMDGFYDCTVDGERDEDHPLCKLIDPNWVLRAPEAVCRTLAYGQQLATSAGANRAEECVDIQTCLEEGPNGECLGGFGYCVREANIWRFRGDACTADAASCQVLATRDNESVSYLLNTVDYAECGPDKIGCRWYETEKTVDADGAFDWPTVNSVEEDAAETFGNTSRVYANATIETCEDGGCRELVVRTPSLIYNMVQNGSFEEDDNSDRFPDGWLKGTSAAETSSGRGIASGKALRLTGSSEVNYPGLLFEAGREYTLTVNARVPAGATVGSTVTAAIDLAVDNPSDGAVNFDFTGYRLQGLEAGVSCTQVPGVNTLTVSRTLNTGEEYVKLGCIFALPNLPDTIRDVAGTLSLRTASGEALFDDVQLEQRAQSSLYAFGYSQAGAKVYAKLPPAYLGCTGGLGDAAECSQYAKVCSPLDEGCKLYTPTNGDPAVSAVVGATNACPAACSGYDTYKQEPTFYEPKGVFPEYLIATTATACSAEAAGCDEFTNLTTEGSEYYSYLRACLNTARAAGRGGVFYTWEGSDTAGYQIKNWNLLVTNMAAGADDPLDTYAPCTTWSSTADGITCTDDVAGDGVPDSRNASCNERADIFTNPDCREFYDSEGRIHYRAWSKTVSVNDACTSYRKTETAGADRAEQIDNCSTSGGFFDEDAGSCIYYGFEEESESCSESENGCRLYTGGRGNNARLVFQDLFESGADGAVPGWDAPAQGDVARSTESLANTGHSLRSVGTRFWTYYAKLENDGTCATSGGCPDIPERTSRFGEKCLVAEGKKMCGSLAGKLFTGKTYTLQFWAKGTGSLQVGFVKNAPSAEVTAQITPALRFVGANGSSTITLSSEWKEYRLGPIDINELQYPDFGPESVLLFDPAQGSTVFVDTVVLREGEENVALIRDSWSTPAVCDMDAGGNYVPQFNLGCREYNSSSGEKVYLKSFSRLCGEDKVGCAGFYDTQASESPYGEVFNAYCTRVLPGTGSAECRLESDPAATDGYAATSPRLCTIQPGQPSCRFNLDYYLPQVSTLDTSLRMTHIVFGSDTETVKPDMPVYAVVNPGSQCNAADAGCTEVGVPVLSADQSRVTSWQTQNLLLDPDNYATALCHEEDLFCEEYTDGSQGKYYFKDPQAKVCEFKEKVTIGGKEYSGWFVTGTTNFCYGVGTCQASPATACVTDDNCPIVLDAAVPGAGTCSVFGTACDQDSDCRLNESCLGVVSDVCRKDQPVLGGRCSNDLAAACDEDLDCGAGNTCITPYIKSGTESGLWRSGDPDYDGWVGTCDPANSGCREFLDPLDGLESDTPYGQSDIKSYYYIENDNLGESNITSGQRCNGQASSEEGCVLFQDTSLPRLTYNTSATSIASEHADTLYGKRPYDLVPPLNCDEGVARSTIQTPDGGRVDLCAQRCVYDQFKVNNIGAEYSDVSDFLATTTSAADRLTAEELENAYIFGGSCLVDNDCDSIRSDSGDLVEGSCRGAVFNTTAPGDGNTTSVPRLENDTNRVLKVNRNRTCAEWIAPDDCRKIWDPELNQFRESCSRLVLCEEYDESGAFACKKPKALDAAVPIDLDFYTGRDASWYGNDYSGYAIGGQFLLNHLTQEQTNAKQVCVIESVDGTGEEAVYLDASGNPTPCTQQSQCSSVGAICKQNPDPNFALVYSAGSCSAADQGDSCAVGYCADSGAACADGDQCPGSSCIVGRCIAPVFDGGTERRCQQDTDCGNPNAVCNAGICEEDLGAGCNIESGPDAVGGSANFGCAALTGRADALCNISTSYKTGTCLNEKCLLTPTGDEYPDEGDSRSGVETFGKVCRANPEIDSPFSNDLVEQWNQFRPISGGDWGVSEAFNERQAYPYNVRSGFENANICAPGEACACSYTKLTASGKTGYVELEADIDRIAEIVTASLNGLLTPDITGDVSLGICSGGPADGAFCVISADKEYGCKTQPDAAPGDNSFATGSFGTCNPINREDQLVGLKGYCLERDSGINIDGNPDLGACLTYFPIDELRGETDLYGKYREAGFFEDAYYCTEVSTYTNLGTMFGCSGIRADEGDKISDDNCDESNGCRVLENTQVTITCPRGYWAVAGGIAELASEDTYANLCTNGGTLKAPDRSGGMLTGEGSVDLWDRTNTLNPDAGPYLCVPKNSYHASESGDSKCIPPSGGSTGVSASGTPYYYSADSGKAWIDEYRDCTAYGVDPGLDEYGVYEFIERRQASARTDYGGAGGNFYVESVHPDPSYPDSPNYVTDLLKIDMNPGTIDNGYDAVVENPLKAAQYYPACSAVSQLATENVGDSSAPYTDKIFNIARSVEVNAFLGFNYVRDTLNKPFGATMDPFDRGNYHGNNEAAPLSIPSCVSEKWESELDSVLDDDDGPGEYRDATSLASFFGPFRPLYLVPSSVVLPALGECHDWSTFGSAVKNYGSAVSDFVEAAIFLEYGRPPGVDVPDNETRLFTNIVEFKTRKIQIPPYELDNYPGTVVDQYSELGTPVDTSNMITRLSNVFATSIQNFAWDSMYGPTLMAGGGSRGRYASTDAGLAWDLRAWGDRVQAPVPPTLYAVDFSNCKGRNCREGEVNALSLNGETRQDYVVNEDGFFRASLEFFAAAYKEQLPIRRIIVDWGDGNQSGSSDDGNFYKNHRGLNPQADDSPYCSSAATEWGLTPDSCDPSWLRYTKTYVCGGDALIEYGACTAPGDVNCFDEDARECRFQPKVHVRDNWGWCTGVCEENGSFDGNNPACFDVTGDLSTPSQESECAYEFFPNGVSASDPWVKYGGLIRIKQSL